MKKFLVTTFLALTLIAGAIKAPADDVPYHKRFWGYYSMPVLFTPEWGILFKPGFIYEFYSREDAARDLMMEEFFVGPLYIKPITERLKLVLAFGYYYMGYPRKDYKDSDGDGKGDKDAYWYSHNLELSPEISYKMGKFNISSKAVFHNKIYDHNDVYKTAGDRWGYSLLLKDFTRLSYSIGKHLNIAAGDEFYYGLVDDEHTAQKYKKQGEPFFENTGLLRNRLIAGGDIIFTPEIKLTPYYVLETKYDPDNHGKRMEKNHIILVTLTYTLRLYE